MREIREMTLTRLLNVCFSRLFICDFYLNRLEAVCSIKSLSHAVMLRAGLYASKTSMRRFMSTGLPSSGRKLAVSSAKLRDRIQTIYDTVGSDEMQAIYRHCFLLMNALTVLLRSICLFFRFNAQS